MSDWKPGDVVKLPTGVRAIADDDGNLVYGRRKYDNARAGSINAIHARPLVVIDPEDAEQVQRLAKLLWPHYSDVESARLCKSEITADALREFADPTPRIEEPTGLGAVVEDDRGCRWVKVDTAMSCDSWTEADAGMSSNPWRKFASLDAARILSPGVPS